MNLAEGIRKIGFRRWYERQLVESHLYFVTGFLSLLASVACVDAFNPGDGGASAFLVAIAGGATMMMSFWSMQRYLKMLGFAAHAAERSVCSACETYGALEVIEAGDTPPEAESQPWLKVRCRKCGHMWVID